MHAVDQLGIRLVRHVQLFVDFSDGNQAHVGAATGEGVEEDEQKVVYSSVSV